MKKTEFKILQQIYNKSFNNSFLLIIETTKNNHFKFIDHYIRENENIYKVVNDVFINGNTHILICELSFTLNVSNMYNLFKNDFGTIDNYFKKEIL